MGKTGKALMTNCDLITLEGKGFRDMMDTYSVLPIPKYTEDQKTYQSCLNDYVSVLCIPVTVSDSDIQTVGAAIEAMASESWRTVAPAYYEVALKVKYVENPEAWDIIDHIIENVKMDPVMAYINALPLSGGAFIKKWRSCAADGASFASSFNVNVQYQTEEKLDGTNGLQTWYRQQLANQ